ncbi:hypothetical protein TrST_g9619 [Triparma strigata]|uniref:Transmembrane protein n=1 Tax=Triparma strigata TaxID=1606541 RepID=A0A9W6ZN18_9STRA|nr:hypothetical protein TrST_g9619 [Triparma strigata]
MPHTPTKISTTSARSSRSVSFSPSPPRSAVVLLPFEIEERNEEVNPDCRSYNGWSSSISETYEVESIGCSIFCPLLLEGRTHTLVTGSKMAGRKLICINLLLMLVAVTLIIVDLPLVSDVVRQLVGIALLCFLFFMRRLRRAAILEAFESSGASSPAGALRKYASTNKIAKALYESFSHGLFTCIVPRDDANCNEEPSASARNSWLSRFGFYCNPLGICALAQEARHVAHHLSKTSFSSSSSSSSSSPSAQTSPTNGGGNININIISSSSSSPSSTNPPSKPIPSSGATLIDFFTHENFSVFQKKHFYLRRNNDSSPRRHFLAASQCSKILLVLMGCAVIVSLLLTEMKKYTLLLVSVVFLQPVVLLYVIYWRSQRFDISLDAVIKLFMVGFFVSSPISLIIETVLHRWLESLNDYFFDSGTKSVINHIVTMFLFSFLVASLCEEATKYYGVVMTRLPSPFPANEIANVSKYRRANACTTYFVCVAIGFSTAENLLLTIMRKDAEDAKLATLFIRFFMPIHVLTSAIMSVFVIQEDIERNDFVGISSGVSNRRNNNLMTHFKGVWGMIKPSFILHGVFDFVLFGLGYFIDGRKPHSDVEYINDSEHVPSRANNLSIVLGAASGLIIICIGLLYYVSIANQQERRLKQEEIPLMSNSREDDDDDDDNDDDNV